MGGEATIKLHTTLDAHLRAKLSLIMHKEMSRSTHTHSCIYVLCPKQRHTYVYKWGERHFVVSKIWPILDILPAQTLARHRSSMSALFIAKQSKETQKICILQWNCAITNIYCQVGFHIYCNIILS